MCLAQWFWLSISQKLHSGGCSHFKTQLGKIPSQTHLCGSCWQLQVLTGSWLKSSVIFAIWALHNMASGFLRVSERECNRGHPNRSPVVWWIQPSEVTNQYFALLCSLEASQLISHTQSERNTQIQILGDWNHCGSCWGCCIPIFQKMSSYSTLQLNRAEMGKLPNLLSFYYVLCLDSSETVAIPVAFYLQREWRIKIRSWQYVS